jgi:predicted Zn-dependent protease
MKTLFRLLPLLLIAACNSNVKNPTNEDTVSNNEDTLCCCPHAYILLQPYGDFTQQEAEKLAPKITESLNKVYAGDWTYVKVLPNKPLPESAYYKPRNRYLANELLKDLGNHDEYIIGLTHKDISWNTHGESNYGIMGLTPLKQQKSIVSDYRTNDLLAVITHEFGHGFWGAKHCTDPNCIMCDYQKHKGKPFVYECCEKHRFMQ